VTCRLATAGAALVVLLTACAGSPPKPPLWFAPNLASEDMLDLFTRPDEWPSARSKVTVFKFYASQILADATGCPECGPNRLPSFTSVGAFSRLAGWGIAIALEVPALKDWGCRAAVTAPLALEAIARVQAGGGSVRYLAMDEPLAGGDACGYTRDESAAETAAFVHAVESAHPEVEVGDIEPYPLHAAQDLAAWLQALRLEQVSLSFFHLDVDRVHADRLALDVAADLVSLRDACRAQAVPFGVILWGADATTDETYFEDVLDWTRRVESALGRPEQTVFQSWAVAADGSRTVPVNLPENDPAVFSHTRLIDEGLTILGAGSGG
jgi:hypothetical protein